MFNIEPLYNNILYNNNLQTSSLQLISIYLYHSIITRLKTQGLDATNR